MKRLSDMSDAEILKELRKKPKKWTFKTHDEYIERLNELHKQAKKKFYSEVYKDVNDAKFAKRTEHQRTLDKLKEVDKVYKDANETTPKEIIEKIAELELKGEREIAAASNFEGLLKIYNKIFTTYIRR